MYQKISHENYKREKWSTTLHIIFGGLLGIFIGSDDLNSKKLMWWHAIHYIVIPIISLRKLMKSKYY